MLSAIKEREELLRNVLELVEEVGRKIAGRYPRSTIILAGSYARGDFNLWSDIDLLIIIDENLPKNPLKRFELIQDVIAPNMEPHVITLEEYERLMEKHEPYMLKVLMEGRPIIDGLKIIRKN